MNECFLHQFTLRISEATFSYYKCPCAHNMSLPVNIEDLKTCNCLRSETLKERHLDVKSLASETGLFVFVSALLFLPELEAEQISADSGTLVFDSI